MVRTNGNDFVQAGGKGNISFTVRTTTTIKYMLFILKYNNTSFTRKMQGYLNFASGRGENEVNIPIGIHKATSLSKLLSMQALSQTCRVVAY